MAIQFCVVCGAGSHRSDWIKKSGKYVACDVHSDAEIARAVAKATTPPQTEKPVALAPATTAATASKTK